MPAQSAEGNQRVRYHDGQLLAGRDLRDDVRYDARMRGLHVRALHGVWGIALGYEVFPTADRRSVQVAQGMAYDCAGREIVLSEMLRVDLPAPPRGSAADAWWFDLLIRHDATDLGAERRAAGSGCVGSGDRGARERPAWRWSYAGDAPTPFVEVPGFADGVRLGEEIPLARVRVTDKGIWTDSDLTVRRVARGLVRPHIAVGQIRQGSVPIEGSPWLWSVRIDTSSGGFATGSPSYFVTLGDHPLLSPTSGFASVANMLTDKQKAQILGPFATVRMASRTGFTLDVRVAAGTAALFAAMSGTMRLETGLALPVTVSWLGVEPTGGCPPSRAALQVLIASLAKIRLLHL